MNVGDVVVQREVVEHFVWSAIPVVVAAIGVPTALYRPAGTTCWWPSHPRDAHPPFSEVTQRGEPWGAGRFAGLLTLVLPGDDAAVSLMWEEDWSFWGWYVDFVRPYEQSSIGWDFADIHLDLVVRADGSTMVKDEDELADAVMRGEVSQNEADRARRRCDGLVTSARRGEGFFSEPWPEWRPDPSWSSPRLSVAAGERLEAAPTPAAELPDLEWWLPPGGPTARERGSPS